MSDHNDAIEMAAKACNDYATERAKEADEKREGAFTEAAYLQASGAIRCAAIIRALKRPDAPAATEAALRSAFEEVIRICNSGEYDANYTARKMAGHPMQHGVAVLGATFKMLRERLTTLSASPAPQKPESSAEEAEQLAAVLFDADHENTNLHGSFKTFSIYEVERNKYRKLARAALAALTRSPSVERGVEDQQ